MLSKNIMLKELKRRKEKLIQEIETLEKQRTEAEKQVEKTKLNLSKETSELKEELKKTQEKLNFLRQAFASSGGKSRVAKKIVKLIPKHKTYVEPFAGGASVYFAKEPSEVEVLNDKDKDVAFAYKFMRKMSDMQIKLLSKYKWSADKRHFINLSKSKPLTDIERFYKFMYIRRFSYGAKGARAGYGGLPNEKSTIVKRLPQLKERLKNTTIENKDYQEILKKYDSKNTFFYIDPPYPETTAATDWKDKNLVFTKEDLKKLNSILKSLKGKFILSIDRKNVNEFKDFKIKKIRTSELMNCDFVPRFEYVVLNYDADKKDFIKNIYDYNPKNVANKQLADDWRIVMAWWSSKKRGVDIKYSLEDIMNLAYLIYNEIVYRVKEGKMKHEFEPEKMKPEARELYKKIARVSFSDRIINIEFLGTGPDTGILNKSGKNRRTRSSLLINGSILIDATPDIDKQLKKRKISSLIITHAHSDAISGLPKLHKHTDNIISLYAFPHTIEIIKNKVKNINNINFIPIEPYQSFSIDGINFIPIPVEHSIIYPKFDPTLALKMDEVLYAEDIDEDFIFSKRGTKFLEYCKNSEYVIIDGAMCEGKIVGHCNIFSLLSKLKEHGIKSKIIFTQIGHNCPDHKLLEELIKKEYKEAVVAYDGMKLNIKILKYTSIKGICLEPPHAELLWKGKKTIILKPSLFANIIFKPFLLVDKENCYGLISLNPPEKTDKNKFRRLFNQHRVTEKEAKKWWGNVDHLYSYKFKWIEKFKKPVKIKAKFGNKSFVDSIDFPDFAEMDNKTLIDFYYKILINDRESPILDKITVELVDRGIMKDAITKTIHDFTIIDGFISLVGSTAEKGSGNDIDLLIRMSKPNDFIKRAIETRIRKMFPENIDYYCPIHFVWGDEAGAHDTHIPLYDLKLSMKREKEVKMSRRQTIKPFDVYLPQKPKGSAYYDLEKLLNKIYGVKNE